MHLNYSLWPNRRLVLFINSKYGPLNMSKPWKRRGVQSFAPTMVLINHENINSAKNQLRYFHTKSSTLEKMIRIIAKAEKLLKSPYPAPLQFCHISQPLLAVYKSIYIRLHCTMIQKCSLILILGFIWAKPHTMRDHIWTMRFPIRSALWHSQECNQRKWPSLGLFPKKQAYEKRHVCFSPP